MFVDLVKTCNSVRHDVMQVAFLKMGDLSKRIEWVEKFHGDFNVVLKLAKE